MSGLRQRRAWDHRSNAAGLGLKRLVFWFCWSWVGWVAGCGPASAPHAAHEGAAQPPSSAVIGPGAEAKRPPSGDATAGAIVSEALATPSMAAGGSRFELLDARAVGIDFHHAWTRRPGQLRNNTTGSGVCLGDYDGDGRVDVFLARSTDGGRLYRNLGNWQFVNATEQAGIGGADRWTTGATFVDVNNDGHLDLYVCAFDCPNHLYINQGDGTFAECGAAYGLDYHGSSAMAAFADFDRDGHLDCYLLTNHIPPPEEIEYSLQFNARGVPRVPDEYREYHDLIRLPDGSYGVIEVGQYDHLYRNNGDGSFTEITQQAGIQGNDKGLSVTCWDFDQDGWPDIYVANDFYGPDRLYRNNGNGTFTDVAPEILPHTPWFSMGADVGDVNNDGWLDFIGTDMASDTHYRSNVTMGDIQEDGWFLDVPIPRQYMRNALFIATGTGRFQEVAYLAGVARTNWTWSARLVDLDQDGWLDLHITNGMSRDWGHSDMKAEARKQGPPNSDAYNAFWDDAPPLREANLAFRNRGNYQFEEVSRAWGLDQVGVSFGAAFGDLDGDGDLDLVVNNFDELVSVYCNHSPPSRAAVLVRLQGAASNRGGIGATVRLRCGDRWQTRYLTLARGFMSASDPTVHFGVGQASHVDELVVEWPSGHRQAFRDLPVQHRYTITEPAGSRPAEPQLPAPPSPLFAPCALLPPMKHEEEPYDDFARQPLLPYRLSQMGPGLAVGDILGNGLDGLYLGAGAGTWGWGAVQREAGTWEAVQDLFPPLSHHQAEDMAVLWLDVDADGDQDLFIASGGIECEPGDERLRDRLYLNEDGEFRSAPERLPDLRESSSVAAAADFDRDGDLDLFVGSRSIPGSYPETPRNALLMNEGGYYRDLSAERAPELGNSGLVTSALWSDVNRDGWIDLLVAHAWGPLRLYLNREGELYDATRDAGLDETHGWWQGLAGRDVDGDGDLDYIATNLGRNTVYQPTSGRPVRLFCEDWDGQGRRHLLEAVYDRDGRLVPLRSKHLLQESLPFLEVACPTYHDFAAATLDDLVSAERLAAASQRSIHLVDSVLLRNDGNGRFSIEPLPIEAQFAPAFGVVMGDFDADGHTDAVLVHNFFGPRRETGRMSGGVGVLLRGDSQGQLQAVPPRESGIVVPGDAKSLVALDLNRDGWDDLVIGRNNDSVLALQHQGLPDRRCVSVRLRGPAGNPTAIGARVTLHRDDGVTQTAEIQAGGGYLSQQSATLRFGLGAISRATAVEIAWPHTGITRHEPPSDGEQLEFTAPDTASPSQQLGGRPSLP